MRELILLRHAHALPASGAEADIDRALSQDGIAEAQAAGKWLVEHNLIPDLVLCSPARRTRETLSIVCDKAGYCEQRIEDELYGASPGTLMELLDAHRDVGRVMVVGHNPGLEQTVALISSGQSGDYRGVPPSGIAVLHLPADAELEPGIATLHNFWWP